METQQPAPALPPPPPGVTSNFVNPETLDHKLKINTGLIVPVTSIFVLLWVYVRFGYKKIDMRRL
ncbi:hypothetical protein F5X98DRAFT_343386 [Xylaria grammica]|nr:hypothetical protein F5X98DRAFT_343386 [Xylaria grammica]